MKKFILVYTSPVSPEEQMQNVSPEEAQKGRDMWMAWFQKKGDAIVDYGAPFGQGVSVFKGGNSKPQSNVTGYSIVQAEDLETVKAMIADHPHYVVEGAGIDIFEIREMPGM